MKLYLFIPQGTLDMDFFMYGADDVYEAERYLLDDNPGWYIESIYGSPPVYTLRHGTAYSAFALLEYEFKRGKID